MIRVPSLEEMLEQYPVVCTAEQVCEILNMTPRFLADLTRARGIRAVRTGRSWSYPKSAVIEWLNVNTTDLAPAPEQARSPLADIANAVRATSTEPSLQDELDSTWGRVRRGVRRETAIAS